jgi:hypothetical protein
MRTTTVRTLVILSLAATTVAPPLAAEPPPASDGLERELRQLNTTLGELVELLRLQLESSNATVLMQRVQLMTSRIAPLEERLRSARAEQLSERRQLDDLALSESSYRGHLETQVEIGEINEEEASIRWDQQQRTFAENKKQIEDRLWAAQQRVIDLEQAIAARRAELETWEGEIDRVLGLR